MFTCSKFIDINVPSCTCPWLGLHFQTFLPLFFLVRTSSVVHHRMKCMLARWNFKSRHCNGRLKGKLTNAQNFKQYWLRQQSDLVKIIRDVNEQGVEIDTKKKQSTILLQKKLRIEGTFLSCAHFRGSNFVKRFECLDPLQQFPVIQNANTCQKVFPLLL